MKIVQVDEHCRAFRRRDQQVLELAHCIWADHVHLVVGSQISIGVLRPKDVEVVEPEVGHYFLKLALAVDRAHKLLTLEFLQQELRRFEVVRPVVRQNLLAVGAFLILIAGAGLLAGSVRRARSGRGLLAGLAQSKLTRQQLWQRILLLNLGDAHL